MVRARGFTVIELVVTLLLLGILAVSLWPRAPSSAALTTAPRAEQLASDIRFVQTLSMTRGQRYCLRLTTSGYSLTVADGSNNCTATTEAHPAGLTQPIGMCTNCLSWTANLSGALVQFDGLGQPYSDASTMLAANAIITVSDEGNTRTITITPRTGRVVVQ